MNLKSADDKNIEKALSSPVGMFIFLFGQGKTATSGIFLLKNKYSSGRKGCSAEERPENKTGKVGDIPDTGLLQNQIFPVEVCRINLQRQRLPTGEAE